MKPPLCWKPNNQSNPYVIYYVVPFAIETSGVWGEEAMRLVTEIGRRTAVVTHEPRSTAFLRQRISVAVQRGNAACINGTLVLQTTVK